MSECGRGDLPLLLHPVVVYSESEGFVPEDRHTSSRGDEKNVVCVRYGKYNKQKVQRGQSKSAKRMLQVSVRSVSVGNFKNARLTQTYRV